MVLILVLLFNRTSNIFTSSTSDEFSVSEMAIHCIKLILVFCNTLFQISSLLSSTLRCLAFYYVLHILCQDNTVSSKVQLLYLPNVHLCNFCHVNVLTGRWKIYPASLNKIQLILTTLIRKVYLQTLLLKI